MPMIDVYAPAGAFEDKHELARRLAAELMAVEGVPDIPMFRQNTAAFIHELSPDAIANVDGGSDYVRVQVMTNAGGLDRDKQIAAVARLTEVIAGAPGNPPAPERIWVLLTEAIDGGWWLWGHAHTNTELVAAVRREMAQALQTSPAGEGATSE
jgi:phenylpyruvate tautomerase PptA (4-oxalocrotonate tautomerase family)